MVVIIFVIMVYDINEKRCNKVLKIGRKYLVWVQNSVLEGNITWAKFEILRKELSNVINQEEDSVIFYTFRTLKYSKRLILGKEKNHEEDII